jgi:hypothetical protein
VAFSAIDPQSIEEQAALLKAIFGLQWSDDNDHGGGRSGRQRW